MARDYVDDHRLLLYQEGRPVGDITDRIGDLTARDERNALSVELSFSVLDQPPGRTGPGAEVCRGTRCAWSTTAWRSSPGW